MPKVLVVESQALFCETIDSFFMVLNFKDRQKNVAYVHTGLQALHAMHENLEKDLQSYSLIMVECEMPGLSGFQLARNIRKLYKYLGVPRKSQPTIVGLASNPDDITMEDARRHGLDKVLSKLLSLSRLAKLLLNLNLIDAIPAFINDTDREEI